MTRGEILSLYRQILRSSKTLRYTDRDYYVRRIRLEFDTRKELKDQAEIGFQIQVYFRNIYTYIYIYNV